MPKVTYKDVIYDSQEELNFKHWLDEAFEAGLIEGYQKLEKIKDTYELIGKQHYTVDGCKKHLFASVNYTPDFVVYGCQLESVYDKKKGDYRIYIDTKGTGDRYHDNKSFQIIRKMMLKLKGIYVHKVVPDDLFLKTWVPELCRYTKVRKDIQKKFLNTPTISEYLNNNKL